MIRTIAAILILAACLPATAEEDNMIDIDIIVKATPSDVWKAWTTEEGIKGFFAPACNVRLEVGGPYEIFFVPESPDGPIGSNGCFVMAYEPDSMLTFSWNAPPHLAEVRKMFTFVQILISDAGQGQTRVHVIHAGFGAGEEWRKNLEYFRHAWSDVVLPHLKQYLEVGPVTWQ